LLNLIKNAKDAFIENSIKNRLITIKTYKEEDKKILEVSDNAGGIPEEIIDKIFDPYVTTKVKKDGTGLGLYLSKMIIEQHYNGTIEVSTQDKQTTFRVVF
ncbi:MAG: ATP-binding protein, partial [Campylobacterota bacterium]|nr:ATP-binding protein [Campylobacterota bacterium]